MGLEEKIKESSEYNSNYNKIKGDIDFDKYTEKESFFSNSDFAIMVIFLTILVIEWTVSLEKEHWGRMMLNTSKLILFLEILKNFQ